MNKIDVPAIRQAASGKWPSILSSVAGLDAAILDGKHHPCPKCGGADRFRWDAAKEFAICNQCFNTKNGDGLAAVQWALGIEFKEAAEKVGNHLGIAPVGNDKPGKDLDFQDWSPNLLPYFFSRRPGITEEALLLNGARMAKYKGTTMVIALPVIGETLDLANPVGWVLMDALGGLLPKWDRKGAVTGHVKTKLAYGSKPGFVGTHAVERLPVAGLPELIWKVEGVSDMLAVFSAIPAGQRDKHLVLTNANGASEKPKWMAKAIARAKPLILHDADQPGEAGAKQWCLDIAKQGVENHHVVLPYDVSETSGKDVRDYLTEPGNNYQSLLMLATKAVKCVPPKDGAANQSGGFPIQDLILRKLKLEVLYECEDGQLRVFSSLLRKSSTILPEKLSEPRLIGIAGPPAMVHLSNDPNGRDSWSLGDIRKALAIQGASRRSKQNERGVGIWPGVREDGQPSGAIVVANNTNGAIWNGEQILRSVEHPRAAGLLLDFGSGDDCDWYDYDELAELTGKANGSPGFCEKAIDDAVNLYRRWNWTAENDPELVTGMILATWLQTIWNLRPMVIVTGESNAGKSIFFESLGGRGNLERGLFGHLPNRGAGSSEAGVRQALGKTARIVLLDEFEKSKDREAILKMLRLSSRGDSVQKGTAGQRTRGINFHLQHIVWCAAIESGLVNQPDMNRFIKLNLLPAKAGMANQLVLPPGLELEELGRRLLAVAIVKAEQALALCVDLRTVKVDGADNRQVEAFSVPTAMLAAALGYDQQQAATLLRGLMEGSLSNQGDIVATDQEDLLEAILTASIRCGTDGDRTVSQIIAGAQTSMGSYLPTMEAHGIRLMDDGGLAVNRRMACHKLLRGTEWQKTRIDEILVRLPGAERGQARMGEGYGRNLRVTFIPKDCVEGTVALLND